MRAPGFRVSPPVDKEIPVLHRLTVRSALAAIVGVGILVGTAGCVAAYQQPPSVDDAAKAKAQAPCPPAGSSTPPAKDCVKPSGQK